MADRKTTYPKPEKVMELHLGNNLTPIQKEVSGKFRNLFQTLKITSIKEGFSYEGEILFTIHDKEYTRSIAVDTDGDVVLYAFSKNAEFYSSYHVHFQYPKLDYNEILNIFLIEKSNEITPRK